MINTQKEILKNYVPELSLPVLEKWFQQRPFQLRIPKKRVTKFGDFRVPIKNELPKISVNGNLNQYAFLITLTHEFAHLLVWHDHKHKAKAHGVEWKTEFKKLMCVLQQKDIFPNQLNLVLTQHMKNPAASSARDEKLVKELRKFDPPTNSIHLNELPIGTKFSLNNKRFFVKGNKRRTRYLCKEVNTAKEYLIHGIAEVTLLE